MKKFFTCMLVFVLAITATCLFVGCTNNNDDDVQTVKSISAKVVSGTTFVVGDAFDSSKITVTATLDDNTTRDVSTTSAIAFDREAMKLDSDGNFTEAGTYSVKVTFADVSTTVSVTVTEAED